MSDYVILDNETGTNLTGGFNRVYTGTGSSGNPSLSYTSGYYAWASSKNAEYNGPGSQDTPMIFINNPDLLKKYKQLYIKAYDYGSSSRNWPSGSYCKFSNGTDIYTSIPYNHDRNLELTVDIPKTATSFTVYMGASNDNGAYTRLLLYKIILKGRKGAKLGDKDVEVHLGETEISNIYLGDTEIG